MQLAVKSTESNTIGAAIVRVRRISELCTGSADYAMRRLREPLKRERVPLGINRRQRERDDRALVYRVTGLQGNRRVIDRADRDGHRRRG